MNPKLTAICQLGYPASGRLSSMMGSAGRRMVKTLDRMVELRRSLFDSLIITSLRLPRRLLRLTVQLMRFTYADSRPIRLLATFFTFMVLFLESSLLQLAGMVLD